MNRVAFVVDGFNLYHSLDDASRELARAGKPSNTKWLDLKSLLSGFLPNISTDAELASIHYFSALATHRERNNPGTTTRHQNYIDCIKDTGVIPTISKFKFPTIWCKNCNTKFQKPEEKKSDVAAGAKILELLVLDEADTVAVVTGDTDFVPAITTAKRLFPDKKFFCIQPYKRKNDEIKQLSDGSIYIKKERYPAHQFADPHILKSGAQVPKPSHW